MDVSSSSERPRTYLRFIGPATLCKVTKPNDPDYRAFALVAYDGSCHLEVEVLESWLPDSEAAELAFPEGMNQLLSSVAVYLKRRRTL